MRERFGDVTMTPQKIALLTDSCADLSPQLAAENQVFVVPLRILCKDGEYRDGVDIHAADIYARLRSGELPQTSLPAAQDISDAFDAIAAAGYDGVIALMLSGGLSGTYNMVRLLAEERRDLTIRVYDSVSGSLGTGMMILQLAEELRQGMDWQTLTERRVPWLIQNTFPFFSVDTLEYLQKGGRIGKVTAMAGTMLQIKPLITFAADGQLQSIAKVRGRNLVIRKLIELVTQSHNGAARYNLAVANGGAPEEMAEFAARLKAEFPNYEHFWEGVMDATLSVYIGDGVIGGGEVADPKECKMIADLGVDMLAAGIGNIHGKYPANWKGLNFDVLAEIQKLTGTMPLVLHGGTGIPADMIKEAISLGVSKINVNTECQLSFADATRKYIEAGKDLEGKGFDPRKLLAPGFEAIKATVKEKMELFGSIDKA